MARDAVRDRHWLHQAGYGSDEGHVDPAPHPARRTTAAQKPSHSPGDSWLLQAPSNGAILLPLTAPLGWGPVSTAPSGEDATTQGEMLPGYANDRRLEKGRLWVGLFLRASEDRTLSHPMMRKGMEKWDEAQIPKHGALCLEEIPEGHTSCPITRLAAQRVDVGLSLSPGHGYDLSGASTGERIHRGAQSYCSWLCVT